MKPGAMINLRRLDQIRSEQVDLLVDGIRGKSGSVLWTSELRATSRGGKCTPVRDDEITASEA